MVAPATTPPQFQVRKNLDILPDPFVWALEITGPNDEPLFGPDGEQNVALRLTSHTVPFEWGTAAQGIPKQWWPVRMSLGPVRQSTDASLHPIDIRLSNAFGLAQLWLENNDSLLEHRCTIYVLNVADLNDAEASYSFPGRIDTVGASLSEVRLGVSAGNFNFATPKELITPICRRAYRKFGCDFAHDPDGSLLGPCAKTLAACEVRGALELALAVEQLHPRRFGGFKGVPRGDANSN